MTIKATLEKFVTFYNALSSYEKARFEKRVDDFILSKNFIAKGNLKEVSEEIKILVASAAVMTTFGFEEIHFGHYSDILVYPDKFFSNYSNGEQISEVNPDGAIVFSWKDLASGFLIPDDGNNIGINCFMRAIVIENTLKRNSILDARFLGKWQAVADKEYERIMQNNMWPDKGKFERKDFFAITAEYFFEKPEILRNGHPVLLSAFSDLINQKPKEA
ncbi:MAG: zinc-dependent peptidase [Cytophagaceae bacterium]